MSKAIKNFPNVAAVRVDIGDCDEYLLVCNLTICNLTSINLRNVRVDIELLSLIIRSIKTITWQYTCYFIIKLSQAINSFTCSIAIGCSINCNVSCVWLKRHLCISRYRYGLISTIASATKWNGSGKHQNEKEYTSFNKHIIHYISLYIYIWFTKGSELSFLSPILLQHSHWPVSFQEAVLLSFDRIECNWLGLANIIHYLNL